MSGTISLEYINILTWDCLELSLEYINTVNECGFTLFANDEGQSLLKSTSMGSHPLLMVDVKSTTVNENTFLLLLDQYVFISSMNAFLKMF